MKAEHISKTGLLLARLCKLTLVNRRGLREVAGTALGLTEGLMDPGSDVLPIPPVSLMDLHTENSGSLNVNVQVFPKVSFSITLVEALTLGILMQNTHARRVFEFGTHRGVSTTELAANLPDDGQIFTLDLPRNDTSTHFQVDNPGDIEVANFPTKGDMIPGALRKKVTFLEQDSALFDPAPYANSMDFIFVDAAHTAEYVQNDSEKAWVMLRPGGIVAWHDCRAQSPDVVKYLRSCNYRTRRVQGTTIAFAQKPEKP